MRRLRHDSLPLGLAFLSVLASLSVVLSMLGLVLAAGGGATFTSGFGQVDEPASIAVILAGLMLTVVLVNWQDARSWYLQLGLIGGYVLSAALADRPEVGLLDLPVLLILLLPKSRRFYGITGERAPKLTGIGPDDLAG